MNKTQLSNKSEFQMFCIVVSIPIDFILVIVSIFTCFGMMINKDWNFIYAVFGIFIFGINLKSIFALFDPDN